MKTAKVIQAHLTQSIKNLPINKAQQHRVLSQIQKLENRNSQVSKLLAPLDAELGLNLNHLEGKQLQDAKGVLSKVVEKITASLPKKVFFKNLNKTVESLSAQLIK